MQNNIEGKEQQTCLVIMTGLLVIWWFNWSKWLVLAAAIIGLIGAFLPAIARWINWAWYKLAEGMGWVMSKVLLSIVFYLFLFPIALLSRLVGKSGLQLTRKDDTYWVERSHKYSKKDLDNTW